MKISRKIAGIIVFIAASLAIGFAVWPRVQAPKKRMALVSIEHTPVVWEPTDEVREQFESPLINQPRMLAYQVLDFPALNPSWKLIVNKIESDERGSTTFSGTMQGNDYTWRASVGRITDEQFVVVRVIFRTGTMGMESWDYFLELRDGNWVIVERQAGPMS